MSESGDGVSPEENGNAGGGSPEKPGGKKKKEKKPMKPWEKKALKVVIGIWAAIFGLAFFASFHYVRALVYPIAMLFGASPTLQVSETSPVYTTSERPVYTIAGSNTFKYHVRVFKKEAMRGLLERSPQVFAVVPDFNVAESETEKMSSLTPIVDESHFLTLQDVNSSESKYRLAEPLPQGDYVLVVDAVNEFASNQHTSHGSCFRVTNLGAMVKRDLERVVVRTIDLGTRAARPNANVQLFLRSDESNESIRLSSTAKTDKDGFAVISKPKNVSDDEWKRLTVDATEGKDRAYIGNLNGSYNYHNNEGMYDNGDYDDYQHRCRTFFNTDRPIYRLGQTVFFNAYTRALEPNGLQTPAANKLVEIVVQNPEYQEFWKGEFRTDRFGSFNGAIKIPQGAKTGNYQVEVKYDENNQDQFAFAVAQYRKPEFAVTVTPEASHVVAGGKLKVNVKANYYFGGGLPNAQISYQVSPTVDFSARESLAPRPQYFKFFESWGLDRGYYPYNYTENAVISGTATTDANGLATIEIPTSVRSISGASPDSYDFSDRNYQVQAMVTDSSRKTVTSNGQALVTQGDIAVVAKPDISIANPGDTIHVDLMAANYDHKPAVGQKIDVDMIQWIVKNGEKNEWQKKVLASQSAEIGSDGKAKVDFALDKNLHTDNYYFVAQSKDANNHSVGDVASIWVCGSESPYQRWGQEPVHLQFDKEAYAASEKAKVLISAPDDRDEHAPILLSVEGTKLHDYRLVTLDKPTQLIELPLRKEYAPNVWVCLTYVNKAHKPSVESKMLCVAPDFHFLKVGLDADKKMYRAGDTAKFTAKVTDAAGKPAPNTILALSVADESVYAAAVEPNSQVYVPPATDIFDAFYSQRENWVATRFSFTDYVDPALTDRPFFDGTGFGFIFGLGMMQQSEMCCKEMRMAGALAPASLPPPSAAPAPREAKQEADSYRAEPQGRLANRPRSMTGSSGEPRVRKGFKDLAGWFPTMITDNNGMAHASVKMPDDLTTWHASAAAITTQSDVGDATTSVMTTQDFIVRLSLPRFFTEGDEGLVTALVHNYSTKTQPVALALAMTGGNLQSKQPLNSNITVPVNGVKRYSWPVKAVQPGTCTIKLVAKGQEAGDALEVKLPVRSFSYRAFFAQGGILKDDKALKKFPIVIPPDAKLADGKMELSLASSSIGPVLANFDSLIDYPYGCTEQTMSRLMPSTIAMRLHKQFNLPLSNDMSKKFDDVYAIAMPKLTEYQHGDGGWGWWKDDESNAYLTAQVLEGLYFLKESGFNVDDSMTERGLDFLQQKADSIIQQKWERNDAVDHAKSAYVLSLYNRPLSPMMETWHMVNLKNMTPEELSYLTMAFKNLKKDNLAKACYSHLLELKNESHDYVDWDHTPELLTRLEGKLVRWDYTYRFTGVESTALALRAVVAMEPQNDSLVEPISRWIITQHDENGWNNTKCTAQVFEALLEKELAQGKGRTTNFKASVKNGEKLLAMLAFKQQVDVGEHNIVSKLDRSMKEVDLAKDGPGWLYYSSLIEYERPLQRGQQLIAKSLPDDMHITRKLYKLTPVYSSPDGKKLVYEQSGKNQAPAGYHPTLLNGEALKAGDILMMTVSVDSPISVPYVMLDAALPSGAEFVKELNIVEPDEKKAATAEYLTTNRYWWTHQDVLDDRVVFFAGEMPAGKSQFTSFMRMEMPGTFNINPVNLEAMYTKKVRGYSGADSITISEGAARD